MSYVAECEQCGVLERGDLEAVGDAAEDQEIDPSLLTDGGQSVDDIERDTHCPNCGKEGQEEYGVAEADFEEWECVNHNCRVSVYRVQSIAPDTDSELITDGGVWRWHYKDATSARSLAGVGTQNHCRNGTRGCPGPDVGGGELPCSACFLQGGDADA